jgi:mannosyltransferase
VTATEEPELSSAGVVDVTPGPSAQSAGGPAGGVVWKSVTSTLVSRRARLSEAAGVVIHKRRRSLYWVLGLLAGAVVVAGVVGRFYAPTQLWLDEALSVDIARLPLGQIPGALRQDGSPPLYYVLLHFWMEVFGQGNVAVRAFSGVVSVATLPLFYLAGRRLAGRAAGVAALLLGASSPFALYYATDVRMYTLMSLLSLLGFLFSARALERPTRRRLLPVSLLTAAILYTHYWGLYLITVACTWALWRTFREWRRGQTVPYAQPGAPRRLFIAMVAGSVLWLPQVPTFIFQAHHTGTPWASAPSPDNLLQVFAQFSGTGPWALLLTFLLFGCTLLALFGRTGSSGTSVVIQARIQPRVRALALIVGGTLFIAVVAGILANAAFVSRYMSVVFPLFLVLCALGVTNFASKKVSAGIVAVACVAGTLTGFGNNADPRTQAVEVAATLNTEARPGDIVVYCPDQLGPAVNRLLTVPDLTQVTYPRMIGPARVDWVNYGQVIANTDPYTFAMAVLRKLGPGNTLWLVWRNGYSPFGGSCGSLENWLQYSDPGGVLEIPANAAYYEYENLVRFPAG